MARIPPHIAAIFASVIITVYAVLIAFIPQFAPLSYSLNLPLAEMSVGPLTYWHVAAMISTFTILPAFIVIASGDRPTDRHIMMIVALCQVAIALVFGNLELAILGTVACLVVQNQHGVEQDVDDFDDEHQDEGAPEFNLPFGFRRSERRKSAKSHKAMIDMLDDGLISIDREGLITSANAAAERLIGTSCEGAQITRFLTVLREPEFFDLTMVDRHRLETTIQRESSATLAVEFSLSGRGSGDDWVGVIRLSDNTDRAEQLAKLEQLALHDSLTGLPNRVLFHDRIDQALTLAGRRNQPMAVMLLDLNKFKQVNDTLGHHVGDMLLQAVGPRLSKPLRATDTLARLGGDEFAVLLPSPTTSEKAMEVAERLVEELDTPFLIDGMTLDLGVSVGVAMYPKHGGDTETLLHNADMAMYKAKREKLGASLFDSHGDHALTRRVKLQQELRNAIDNGDLEVLYQPKVSTRTWEVTGFEALVRWQHPELGELAPSEFIPLAEHTGLIMPMTLAVVNACLSAQKSWRQAGFDLSVAVNLSPKWLQDREFPKILRLLLETGMVEPTD